MRETDFVFADHSSMRELLEKYGGLSDGLCFPQAEQVHCQSRTYNRLQGDIKRWFGPIPGVVSVGLFARRPADVVIIGGEPPQLL